MKRLIVIAAFAVLCCLCTDVSAASMYGKVIDVSSGDVFTITNLNRPVRVKLMGVDAPEMDQAFGDTAKKHLSELILGNGVVVEYLGIGPDRSVAGKVLLRDADVGAQMIRDGAAWFDPSNVSHLSEMDREIYKQSEQAARNERRGLWQAESPTAPWEFVKAKALQKDKRVNLSAVALPQKPRADRRYAELTSLNLRTRDIAPTTSMNAWAESGPVKEGWYRFRPPGEDFSALVPHNGKQYDAQVPFDGEVGNVTLYVGREGWSTYMVQWLQAQTRGESHEAALSEGMTGFALGVTSSFGQFNSNACRPTNEKFISVHGLSAIEFELGGCVLQGRVRIVTKLANGKRRMYVLGALFLNEDENVPRFLNSFSIDTPTSKPRKR